ncbi:MAG: hypothetical protein WD824_16780 [Cyclobacteriaceae bacterium]
MKKQILKLIGLSLVAFYFLGCDDEEIKNPDPTHSRVWIQFPLDKETIKENAGEKTIKVTPFLNEALGEDNWEVDYNNPSKVLTVVGEKDKNKIIQAVEKAGYKAEAL